MDMLPKMSEVGSRLGEFALNALRLIARAIPLFNGDYVAALGSGIRIMAGNSLRMFGPRRSG